MGNDGDNVSSTYVVGDDYGGRNGSLVTCALDDDFDTLHCGHIPHSGS